LTPYCNHQILDAFFQTIISRRTTSAAVNHHYVSAVQKFSDYWEERTRFVEESTVVKKALSEVFICRKKFHSSDTTAHVDSHKHRPTRQLSLSQELILIDLAWKDHCASRR
jgi:hypothetical protein